MLLFASDSPLQSVQSLLILVIYFWITYADVLMLLFVCFAFGQLFAECVSWILLKYLLKLYKLKAFRLSPFFFCCLYELTISTLFLIFCKIRHEKPSLWRFVCIILKTFISPKRKMIVSKLYILSNTWTQ